MFPVLHQYNIKTILVAKKVNNAELCSTVGGGTEAKTERDEARLALRKNEEEAS